MVLDRWLSLQGSRFRRLARLGRAALPERLFSSICEPETARPVLRFQDSEEFFSVRDYQPGDPLKRIHWKLFARRDYPVVREYLPLAQPELAIYVDVSRPLRFAAQQSDLAVALAQKHAGGVAANRTLVDIEERKLHAGIKRPGHDAGSAPPGKPRLHRL